MRLLLAISRFSQRHAWGVLAFFALSLIPALWLTFDLRFKESFGELLPHEHRAVQDLDAVTDRLGGTAFIVVALDARDRSVAERFANELEGRLAKLETVLFVEGRLDLDFIRDRQLLYLSSNDLERVTDDLAAWIDERVLSEAGLFVDLDDDREAASSRALLAKLDAAALPVQEYLVGKDGRYLYQFVRLRGYTGDLGFGRRAMEEVQRTVAELKAGGRFPAELDVRYSGSVVVREEEHEIMTGDLRYANTLAIVGVVLMISLWTRRFRSLILTAVPLLVSEAWTFGFARLAIGHLNILTGFLAAILSGLGVDYAMHLFMRYLEERRGGLHQEAACDRAMETSGRAIVSGATTNAGAFFVLRFAEFQGYSEFGLVAFFGLLFMVVISLFMFPALNTVLEKIWPAKISIEPAKARGLVVPPLARTFVLTAIPLFAAYSWWALETGRVKFHTNFREIRGESPAADFDDYIISSLGSSLTLTMVLLDDPAETPKLRRAIAEVQAARKSAGQPSGIERTLALADLVPDDQPAKIEEIAAIEEQLSRVKPEQLSGDDRKVWDRAIALTAVSPFTSRDLPSSLRRRFEPAKGEGTLVLLFTDYLFYDVDELIAWSDEMDQIKDALDRTGAKARIMSENWVAGIIFELIIGDGPYVVWSAFLVVLLIVWIDFRSLRHALVVVTPLVLGVLSISGGMAIGGIELNFINAVVIPVIVGIGVDSAIHIYHRFLEDGPDSIPVVLRNTSAATFVAAGTTLVGFGAMVVAHHRGIRSLGLLALLGTTTTYVTTSIFFPIALEALHKAASRLRR